MKTAETLVKEHFEAFGMMSDLDIVELMQTYADQFKQEWVSVEDGLPEIKGLYLCYCLDGKVIIGECYENLDGLVFSYHWDITHWQPLTPPPTK